MTTHDFRPGDVVKWGPVPDGSSGQATVLELDGPEHVTLSGRGEQRYHNCFLRHVSIAAPTEHPSRSRAASSLRAADPVDHPAHYTDHPSGVECITVTEHMNFNVGNAVKYLWRAGRKGDALTDLRKAAWYVNREIERLTREGGS